MLSHIQGLQQISPANPYAPVLRLQESAKRMMIAETYADCISRDCDIPVQVLKGHQAIEKAYPDGHQSSIPPLWASPNTSEVLEEVIGVLYDASEFAKNTGLPIKEGKVLATKGYDGIVTFQCVMESGDKMKIAVPNLAIDRPMDSGTFRNTVGKALQMAHATYQELLKVNREIPGCYSGILDYDPSTRKADLEGFAGREIQRLEDWHMKYHPAPLSKKEQEYLDAIKAGLYAELMEIANL